jgi:hypothetical protein
MYDSEGMSKSNRVAKSPPPLKTVALRRDAYERMDGLKGRLSYAVFLNCLLEAWDNTLEDDRMRIIHRVVHSPLRQLEPTAA